MLYQSPPLREQEGHPVTPDGLTQFTNSPIKSVIVSRDLQELYHVGKRIKHIRVIDRCLTFTRAQM